MLTIWSAVHQPKVFTALAPVLPHASVLPVRIVKDFSVPPGTTTLLGLGSHALTHLQSLSAVPKNRTLTSLRKVPLQWMGVPTMLSYSPDIGEIDHGHYVDLLTDVGLIVRYQQTGSWTPILGTYEYVPDFSQTIALVEAQFALTGQPVDVTHDTETVGLDPYRQPCLKHPGAWIVMLQFTVAEGMAHCMHFPTRAHWQAAVANPTLRAQVEWLLNSPMVKVKGANLKYDLHWHWVWWQMTSTRFTFDTTIVGSLLDENRSNALNVHTKIYVPHLGGYDDEFERTVDKSRMDLVPPAKMLPYGGGDTDACLHVAAAQKTQLLKDQALTRFYVNVLHPAARAFEGLEQHGIYVDLPKLLELKADLEAEHLKVVGEAKKILGGRIVAKHFDPSKGGGLNLTKPALLCDFMFSPMGLNLKPKMMTNGSKAKNFEDKKPSTAMEHLELFAKDERAKDFIALVREDGSINKTLSTYVDGFMEHMRADGKLHPTYYLFVGNKDDGDGGARTGRLSCKDPAWQTLPKHTKYAKRIRRCFPAPPGYVVLETDYNQGELKVIACIADETNMIAAYRAGKDLHVETAAAHAGYTYDALLALGQSDDEAKIHLYDETRQLGKAGNFGLIFGMGAEGFMNYAEANYGVEMELEEAEHFRTSFFQKYPELIKYHKTYKALAHQFKMVRTPMGRLRHLPLIDSPKQELRAKAERQSINAPVQGTLTDMMLWYIALQTEQGLTKIAPAFGTTHDSCNNYVPEDRVDEILPKLLDVMQNLPFHKLGWHPQLKFTADAKIGINLGEMKAWKPKS